MRFLKTTTESGTRVEIACALLLASVVVVTACVLYSPSQAVRAGQTDRSILRVQSPIMKSRRHASAEVDPTLHLETLQIAETSRYEGSGRNLFETNVPAMAPDLIRREIRFLEHPQVQPMAAPFSTGMRFFGFSSSPTNQRVFLLKGEDLFIAQQGDTIDRRYRITQIMRDSVELEDELAGVKERILLSTL